MDLDEKYRVTVRDEYNAFKSVVTSLNVQFLSNLSLFEKYEIHSRLIHIGEKAFYVESKCVSKNGIVAAILLKFQMVGEKGVANPLEIFKNMCPGREIPIACQGSRDRDGLEALYTMESYLLDKQIALPSPTFSPEL